MCLLATGAALSKATPEVAVVVLDAPNPMAASAGAGLASQSGARVLPLDEIVRRLTGTESIRTPDVAALEEMVTEARAAEASFASTEALNLRMQVLDAFRAATRPGEELRQVVAAAAVDLAAGLWAEGQKEAAAEMALEVVSHYLDGEPDPTIHAPPIRQLFYDARERMDAGTVVPLTVRSNRGGRVYADARYLGLCGDDITFHLPPGRYRVWVERQHTSSLPHLVELVSEPVVVAIDADFEEHVSLGPEAVYLECGESCVDELAALGRMSGVPRVLGAKGTGDAGIFQVIDVAVEAATATERLVDDSGAPFVVAVGPAAMPAFSPLYLIPFGGGQLAQERYAVGAAYLTAQVGLLAWHVAMRVALADAQRRGDLAAEPELAALQDASMGLLIGAVAGAVAEAVLVGALWGE